jgi:hypothetical protein
MMMELNEDEIKNLSVIELDVVNEIIGMKELKTPITYDKEKLEYNAKYRSFEYYAKKFPTGWEYIPGFDKIIEMCRSNASSLTPMQEIELRHLEQLNIEID